MPIKAKDKVAQGASMSKVEQPVKARKKKIQDPEIGKTHWGTIRKEDGSVVRTPVVITDIENRLVKRVHPEMDFHANVDIDPLDEETAECNTEFLHRFLVDKGLSAVLKENRKGSFIRVMDYDIRYVSHGFSIVDLRQYKKHVNINKFCNDFSEPQNVLDFLIANQDRPTEKITKKEQAEKETLIVKDKARVEAFTKLADKFNVVELKEKPVIKPHEMDKETACAAIEKLVDRFHKGSLDYETFKQEVFAFTRDKVLRIRLGKVLKRFNRRNCLRFCPELITVFSEYKGFAKRAPKFTGIILDDTGTISCDLIEQDGKQVVITRKKKDRKITEEVEAYHTYLWRRALYVQPKAMRYLIQVAKGELSHTFDKGEECGYRFIDETIAYDSKVLNNPVNLNNFLQACDDCLTYNEVTYPLQYNFELPEVGTKVLVYWGDYAKWYRGVVISDSRVRYEDGSVCNVNKTQKVRLN